MKKKEKKRILFKNITTCRIDTWRGVKSLGGSVSTIDECGLQPPEPRERCALLKKPSVNLERQKERDRGDGEEKKATRCTSCCTYPPPQLHQPNNSSNSSHSTQQLHSETGSLQLTVHRQAGVSVRDHLERFGGRAHSDFLPCLHHVVINWTVTLGLVLVKSVSVWQGLHDSEQAYRLPHSLVKGLHRCKICCSWTELL